MAPVIKTYVALLTATASLTTCSAIPFRRTSADPVPSTALLSAYAVPTNNGTKSLPDLNKPLQAITLGRGIQNYTCATPTSASKPKAIGAVATLFDLHSLLTFFAPGDGQAFLNEMPALMLSLPHAAVDNSIIPQAGKHYFDASGTPVFDLSKLNNGFLLGNKTGDIAAPPSSTHGPFGAVDWLSLDAKQGSKNLSRVYRTITAAGSPPPDCAGQASVVSIEYAALYYFVSA